MVTPSDIRKASILIVDDQEANVMLLEQMLTGAGYVFLASTRNPREVAELHRKNRYDLIVLDLQMPGMDGFEVMENLKEIEAGGYLPVLVITAQPDHKLRALKAGARDFISKPFDLAEVLIRVQNMLEVRLLHLQLTIHNFARLENSQRIAGLGDWEHDLAAHRLEWSEGMYRILGLSRRSSPPSTETFDRLVHPDDLARVWDERNAAIRHARRGVIEHRILRPDGKVRHCQQIIETSFDERGRPARETGTLQDITERTLAEESLHQGDERHRKMLMLSPDAHFVHVDGIITFVNQAFCALMGATGPAGLLGRPAIGVVHPGFLGQVNERLRRILADESVAPSEMKFVRLDGTTVDVEIASVDFDFCGHTEVQVIARDITTRQQAVTALRESEERFKFVARAVSDVVWDWNLATNFLWWNDGFLTTFGFAVGEIEPTIGARTDRIHAEDRGRVVESLRHAIGTKAETWKEEYRLQCKDGSYAQVEDCGYIVRNAAGRGVRMVGGMRDLTEQKQREAQFFRTQRMDSIGTLAGGIAHDLNNVLAPILMSIELLQLDLARDPRRTRILGTIQSSCRRGADLVRQVLSFARGQDGQRVAIQLRHLIDELEGIIGEIFPRNIRIQADLPGDLWPIRGDPTQLHQVLLNLAINARDAMPQGGSLILTAANVPEVDAMAAPGRETRAGPYVLLQVADTGFGMTAETRERIFEPFFTTKEIGKGTGIGLATVHTVVKNHGGFLQVESAVDRGTTFRIYLPADPTLRTGQAVPAPVAIPHGRNELVLVVDDESSIRDIARQTLEAFGYRVIVARDGAEAVAMYVGRAQEIGVVVTDMIMPVMDGATTIQVLKRINPAVRMIVGTGGDADEAIARIKSAGGTDILAKPYTADALLVLIREVLDRPVTPCPAEMRNGHLYPGEAAMP